MNQSWMKCGLRRGRIMNTDIGLCAMMIGSLLALHVMGEHGFLGGVIALPPLVLPFFFLLPLCDGFLHGIAAARESMRGGASVSPTASFRQVLRPRMCLWLVLWILYFASLEAYLFKFAGGGNLIVSLPSAGLVLLMVASCLFWAPRCRKRSTLAILTLLTPLLVVLVSYPLAFSFVYFIGPRGYMDLGLATIPPLISSAILLVAAIGVWLWSRHQGDAWFRP